MSTRFMLRAPSGQETVITGPFRIGRGDECQIRVDNNLVSRIHASIWIDHDHLILRDERSRNGTFLNGRQLVPGEAHYLHHDDEVRIGDTTLVVASDPPYPRPRQHRGLPGQPEDEPPPTAEIPKSDPELQAALAKVDAASAAASAGASAAAPASAPAQRSLVLPLIIGGCLVLALLVLCLGLGVAAVTIERGPISTLLAPSARHTATPLPPAGVVRRQSAGGRRQKAGGRRQTAVGRRQEVGKGKWEKGRQEAESSRLMAVGEGRNSDWLAGSGP